MIPGGAIRPDGPGRTAPLPRSVLNQSKISRLEDGQPGGVNPIDIVVTGANGAVGQALIQHFSQGSDIVPRRIRALVRSVARAEALRPLAAELIEIDYSNPLSLREAVEGAEAIVHFAGGLKTRPGESLWESNCGTTLALLEAVKGIHLRCFVFLSHPGSDLDARNGFLQSKGIAEKRILDAALPGAIFRVPMILGQGNESLERILLKVRAPIAPLVGGGSVRVQSVSQSDVIAAIEWVLSAPPMPMQTMGLSGPDTVTYADLIGRVARRLGKQPKLFPVPKLLARLAGWATEAVSPATGSDRAALDTIFTEHIEPAGASAKSELPFALAPVNETLNRIFPMTESG